MGSSSPCSGGTTRTEWTRISLTGKPWNASQESCQGLYPLGAFCTRTSCTAARSTASCRPFLPREGRPPRILAGQDRSDTHVEGRRRCLIREARRRPRSPGSFEGRRVPSNDDGSYRDLVKEWPLLFREHQGEHRRSRRLSEPFHARRGSLLGRQLFNNRWAWLGEMGSSVRLRPNTASLCSRLITMPRLMRIEFLSDPIYGVIDVCARLRPTVDISVRPYADSVPNGDNLEKWRFVPK